MHIKTTMRYHLTPVKTAIIKSLQMTNIDHSDDVEKRERWYPYDGNVD